jgi:8-hydroxy-5-deazaflavin:NADPH oxidoreductase
MNVSIIGVGNIGGTLARHIIRLGHRVSVASARGPERLRAFASEIGAAPVSVSDAPQHADLVVVSIPQKSIRDLPRDLFDRVSSKVPVVDTGNYYPELRDGRIEPIDRGMLDSQWVEQQLGRPVIKAFNTIFARSLLEKGAPRGVPGRVALPVAGDSPTSKAMVLQLIDELGFDGIDAGGVDDSWRQQPGMPAYCRDLDAAALRLALAQADRHRIAKCRAEQEARTMDSLHLALLGPIPGGNDHFAVEHQ